MSLHPDIPKHCRRCGKPMPPMPPDRSPIESLMVWTGWRCDCGAYNEAKKAISKKRAAPAPSAQGGKPE